MLNAGSFAPELDQAYRRNSIDWRLLTSEKVDCYLIITGSDPVSMNYNSS